MLRSITQTVLHCYETEELKPKNKRVYKIWSGYVIHETGYGLELCE